MTGKPTFDEVLHQLAASNVALSDMAGVLETMRKTMLKGGIRPSKSNAEKMAAALSQVSMVAMTNHRMIHRAGQKEDGASDDRNAPRS